MTTEKAMEQEARRYKVSWFDTYDVSELIGMLAEKYNVESLPPERYMEADYLFSDNHSVANFDGVRIMLTGENHPADLNLYDYCLTHSLRQDARRLYFPYWHYNLYGEGAAAIDSLENRPLLTAEELQAQERKFCAFVCRNGACRVRNEIVRSLSERRRVDCGGAFMNNIGYRVPDKIEFQSGYIFSIAYENEESPGYLTEKIFDAFLSRSIPIYWGDPNVEDFFNPDAFVHARRFRNKKELVDYVIALADDPEAQLRMLNAPVFREGGVVERERKRVLDFFAHVFEHGPVIQRTRLQRLLAVMQNFYGHGFFRTVRRISRRMRGKMSGSDERNALGHNTNKWE